MGRLRFLLLLPLIGIAAVGLPQDGTFKNTYGYSFNNPTSAQLNKFAMDSMNARMVYRVGLKKMGYTEDQMSTMTTEELKAAYLGGKIPNEKPENPPERATKKDVPTRFKPSGGRILMPALVDHLTKVEEERKVLKDAFEQSLVAFEAEAKKEGFPNDVAAAIGFFTAVTFKLHDGVDPNEDGVTLLVKAIQIKLDTPEYRKATDADKQSFYEFMVSMGAYLYMTIDVVDEKMQKELRDVSALVVEKFLNIDVTKMKLTANGLEKR